MGKSFDRFKKQNKLILPLEASSPENFILVFRIFFIADGFAIKFLVIFLLVKRYNLFTHFLYIIVPLLPQTV